MMQCAAKKTLSISRMKVGGMYRSPFFSSQVVTKRYIHKVSLQLDYYMSPQFAGIAVALSNSLYQEAGMELNFLPICPVGLEMNAVRNHANNAASSKDVAAVSIGSVEQNIFVPTLQQYPGLGLNAVAAMFRRSPLCLASLANTDSSKRKNPTERLTVGVHEDSVSVIQKVLAADTNNSYSVLASPRSTKNTDLLQGKFDSVQAYLTTEVPTLERQVLSSKLMGTTVVAKPLEGMNGAKLGYSQVLFCPKEDLSEGGGKREVINSFLDVTFRGWEEAIRDPESAARSVDQCRAMLRLDEENNDHWHNSFDYTVQSVGLCGNFVKETFQGDRLGVIDAQRWNDATNWLLEDDNIPTNFGLDETEIWKPSSQLLAGNELARNTLEKAANSARAFCGTHDRKPSLAVVTVGELPRYTHGERRLQLYSNNDNSWFNKTSVGLANGFEVQEILLPPTTTTDELLSQLYALDNDATVDGIQLMWPLPPQIDAAKAYNSISLDRDVDGAHYIGQLELGSPSTDNMSPFPLPPVTPMSIITLMDHHDVSISNRSILVVGRSRIVGSPLAHMLRERGAIVTVAHSQISSDKLESLVKSADIVVSCAGSPKLIKSEWIQEGTDVINCGSTFDYQSDTMCSDFDGDLASVANKYSPVPGGVGPLSVAFLLKNVANAAQERVANDANEWTRKIGCLHRTFHFPSYDAALIFANKVNSMSSALDHHANMTFSHKCVHGVDVDMEFFTFEANEVTDKDYKAARNVNAIFEKEQEKGGRIMMKNFTYDLNIDSIAKYPASPRGSSRLVRVDGEGSVSHYKNFSEAFVSLAKKGSHVVFNQSKVVNARLSVKEGEKGSNSGIEMMILDLGECIDELCNDVKLTVMIRKEEVSVGDIFTEETCGTGTFIVVDVICPWIEDEKSNGNGTECIVQCTVADDKNITLANFLDGVGTVPIPPYLDRSADNSDISSYNNVYASGNGSVAAPTAGLHFTDELLTKIGHENISYLSLHVGAGTFKPVVTEDARDHSMHGESFVVDIGELGKIIESLENERRLIVVGTTSARTLESLYWIGVKILKNRFEGCEKDDSLSSFELGQNEWSHLAKTNVDNISAANALRAVVDFNKGKVSVSGRTSLMIAGDYDFKVVNDLVTNFHAPDSTLMLLVSAFLGSGETVRSVYEEAQDLGYKFLSYGDSCFFTKRKK